MSTATMIKGHVKHGGWSRAALGASFLCCLLQVTCGQAVDEAEGLAGSAPELVWSADPAWSPSGDAAIGQTVSSILDDQWGNPDNHGPAQLLSGDVWTSRHGSITKQWIIFDLGQQRVVHGIRTKGYDHDRSSHWQSRKSPKDMELQSSATVGAWDTRSSFRGFEGDDDWKTSMLPQPHSARYWRLWIANNWGAKDYVSISGLEFLLESDSSQAANTMMSTGMDTGIMVACVVVVLCLLAGVSLRCCRNKARQTAGKASCEGGEAAWEDNELGGAAREAPEDEAHPVRQPPSKAGPEKSGTSSDLPVAVAVPVPVAVPVRDTSVVRVVPDPTEPEV